MDMFNYSGHTFYVAFKNQNPKNYSTFTFKVKVMDDKEVAEIKEDYFVSGILIKNEIVNYVLDLYTGEPESFALKFNL